MHQSRWGLSTLRHRYLLRYRQTNVQRHSPVELIRLAVATKPIIGVPNKTTNFLVILWIDTAFNCVSKAEAHCNPGIEAIYRYAARPLNLVPILCQPKYQTQIPLGALGDSQIAAESLGSGKFLGDEYAASALLLGRMYRSGNCL